MNLTTEEKVRFLRDATRGPADAYALRSHVPSNDPPWRWRPVYGPLIDDMVVRHLRGDIEIGSYALIPMERDLPRVWWIAADFDGKRHGSDWESDVRVFMSFLADTGANILVNRSRSGFGAHVRVLFREMVPAWMARRWMTAWLEEAGVVSEFGSAIPSSFDRLIPPQDTLLDGETKDGHRRPGNLIGAPMHRGRAIACGGTLPISVEAALAGEFAPDGKHWEHLVRALEGRSWGELELRNALIDAPGKADLNPPSANSYTNRQLTVLNGGDADVALLVTRRHCEFFRYLQAGGDQPYSLWIALASQLHHFGEAGRDAFHELSALDHRYNPTTTEQKWDTTRDMRPMRCETLVDMGFRCPHLASRRCNGARTPAYFPEHAGYEPI